MYCCGIQLYICERPVNWTCVCIHICLAYIYLEELVEADLLGGLVDHLVDTHQEEEVHREVT